MKFFVLSYEGCSRDPFGDSSNISQRPSWGPVQAPMISGFNSPIGIHGRSVNLAADHISPSELPESFLWSERTESICVGQSATKIRTL